MTQFMEKKDIIMLKEQGLSNRAVSRRTSHDRKTVAKYWNEYRLNLAKLSAPGADVKAVQAVISVSTITVESLRVLQPTSAIMRLVSRK